MRKDMVWDLQTLKQESPFRLLTSSVQPMSFAADNYVSFEK